MSAYFKRIKTKIATFFAGGFLMREQKLFLSTVSLFFVASAFSGIFINTFIYLCAYASGEVASGLIAVAYYNLCMYGAMAFFSVVTGIIGKAVSSRTLIFTGLILHTLLYILLLSMKSSCVNYIWLLGILSGMGNAFFNLNYSSGVMYVTSSEGRGYYLFIQGIINSASAVLSPLISGVLASLIGGINGFVALFVISLIVLIIAVISCFSLTYQDGKKGATQFGNVFVFSVKNKSMRMCAVCDAVNGIRDGVSMFLIPLLIFTLEMSNVGVGIYMFIYALVQMLLSYLPQSHIIHKKRMGFAFLACVLYALSGFILIRGFNMLTLFSYGILSALIQGFFVTVLFSAFYDAAYKMPHASRKNLEILSVREFYINIGRIIGVFTIMFVLKETTWLIYTMIIFGILQMLSWVMLVLSSRQLADKEI
ncbi:MAG: MFS transporter [Ruminococcaceae bacterium]|nr:MFS transporter [Oscillospiraceae bacterium]